MTMRRVLSLSIRVKTLEPFRIGGRQDPLSEAEKPVALVGGRVCIPGPSLKGALRHETERFLIASNFDRTKGEWPREKADMKPCIPGSPSPDEQKLMARGLYRSEKPCHYPCEIRQRGGCASDVKNAHSICPVCYLFGAQGLKGFVNVPFLFSDSSPQELYSARMDRTSGTVVHGTNRPYQLIPPGSVFIGTLEVVLLDQVLDWQLGKPRPLAHSRGDAWLRNDSGWDKDRIIKELILDRLKAVERLGGYRSKGFGRVEIEVEGG